MNSQKPYLQAKGSEKIASPSVERYRSSFWKKAREAMLPIGLQATAFTGANLAIEAGREMTDSNVAHAQTDPRQAESHRLFVEGTAAFRSGDFVSARGDFLESERLRRELRSDSSPEMSWNIALCDMRIAGFEFITSTTSPADARPINARNHARLETVLGFSIAQIRPVRDNMIDARDRMSALVSLYQTQLREVDALPEPANPRERRERTERRRLVEENLRLATEAVAFARRFLEAIEPRYHELESAATSTGDGHTDGSTGRGTGDGRVVVVEGVEYVEHREDVWFTTPRAVTLATGVAGLAAAGVGLAGYLLNNSDGQANLSQCREEQRSMRPCPLALEREFQANSDRANAFGITAWIGAGVAVTSTVIFLVLPSETSVRREPRTTTTRARTSLFGIPDFTITPIVTDTMGGMMVGGRF